MASKESNPGVTNQILNLVAIFVLFVVEIFFMIMFIKFRSNDAGDIIEGVLAMCGLCMTIPAFAIFLLVCSILTLVKRDIYGGKHSSSVLIAFILQIVGIILLGLGWVIFPMMFDADLAFPLWMGIPFIPIAWGWFLELKEVGGKVPALFGALAYSFGKIIFIFGSILVFSSETPSSGQDLIFIPVIGISIAIIGLILLFVAEILSTGWMKKHPPLIDTEQRAMMQMQQQQLEMQRQQLIATQQLQAQLTGGTPPPQIPHTPPPGGTMKICLSCGQQVGIKFIKCPFCGDNTSGPGTPENTSEY